MRFFLLICAFLLAGFAPQAFASEADGQALLNEERAGLQKLSRDRLLRLLTEPARGKRAPQLTRAWLDAQPDGQGGPEWRCLTEALYFEARGEPVLGQVAVAEVIMNRVASDRFPSTLCGVINQGTGKRYQCQFSYTCDGLAERISEPAAYARMGKVARLVMDGAAPSLTDGATHYHTNAVRPKWAKVYTKTKRIGVHIFYRHTWRTASN